MSANATATYLIGSYITSMNEFFHQLAGFGYIGIFLISLIGNASIILPVPSMIFVFLMAAEFNPVLLALFAGAGSSIGELTSYGVGFGGSSLTQKKKRKWSKTINRTEEVFQKYGVFWVIVVFAATPLPHDIVGLVSGALKYDIRKFLVATFIGKFIINLIAAVAGLYSLTWVIQTLGV